MGHIFNEIFSAISELLLQMSDRQFPPQTTATLALLFPVGVIAAFTLGRAVGNLALVALLGFAIFLFAMFRIEFPRWSWLIVIFLIFPLIGLLIYGLDKYQGLLVWARFVLVFFSTWVISLAVSDFDVTNRRATRIFFGMWLLVLFVYVLRAGYFLSQGHFSPASQLNGLHVSALYPLALVVLFGRLSFVLGCGVLALMVLFIGDSRTEVLMLLVSVSCILGFYYRKIGLLVILFPLAFSFSIIYGFSQRGFIFDASGGLVGWLNDLSSARLLLWSMAFDHSPENAIIGVGMGQSRYYFEYYGYSYLSFHNAFIEALYDGGWLWLGFLLAIIFLHLRKLPSQYQRLNGEQRWIYSCYFGALATSIVACLLDRGYSTVLFNVFMIYCLVILYRHGNAGLNVSRTRAEE